jgi:hypothetical protein
MAAGQTVIRVDPPSSAAGLRKLTEVTNTVSAAHKNVLDGPGTLKSIQLDNTVTASSKNYLKVYDIISDALVAGTSAPHLILPVRVVGTNPVAGIETADFPKGLSFANGVSVLASKENGDTMTAAPDQAMDVYLLVE